MTEVQHKGQCLCGAVAFTVTGDLPTPTACHCSMCRRHTGHFLVSTEVQKTALQIHDETQLRWYRSSDRVQRGFCATCGASLFFDAIYRDWVAVSMGAFEPPTGTQMSLHIFTADKGDYYVIADGLPQNPQ